MVFSKRELEGYVRIDHRDSPGIDGMPFRGKNSFFEGSTFTCSHCPRVTIINPLRIRERAYCHSCDHLICDECGTVMKLTGICVPFKKVKEDYIESIMKGTPNGS